MKARSYPVVLSLALGLAALAGATDEPAGSTFDFIDPDDPDVAAIRQCGERVIDQAGNALLLEVRRLLATMPPAEAVGRVHLQSFKLPAAAQGRPAVSALRRISLRTRNPANSPDIFDRAALDKIQGQLERGDAVSPLLLQKIAVPGLPVAWRVYRPLAALNQCLACHGPVGALDPEVVAALQRLYPEDKAADYKPGEWRGLLRVSVDVPAKR